jgi:hypothetical protein
MRKREVEYNQYTITIDGKPVAIRYYCAIEQILRSMATKALRSKGRGASQLGGLVRVRVSKETQAQYKAT